MFPDIGISHDAPRLMKTCPILSSATCGANVRFFTEQSAFLSEQLACHIRSVGRTEIEHLRSHADQHREASNALNQALSEIERLRSHADQHREQGAPPDQIAS